MTVEETVYSALSGAAGITALVAANKIKPEGDWQALARPYIIHFPVTLETTHTHTGMANFKKWLYQISCFGDSYASAKAVAEAVKTAFQSYRSGGIVTQLTNERRMPFEFETRVSQIVLEFDIFDML